jgi:arylsulfatase A
MGATIFSCGNVIAGSFQMKRPNIVFILVDDQGWTGLSEQMDPDVAGSCSDYYQTKNLARLVSEGMRFSRGYAPAPVCSPTRHSIQFGKNPANLGITHNNYLYRQHCDPKFALGNLIKAADEEYTTAHLGKWHISFSPDACGYDVNDGSTTNEEGDSSTDPEDPKRIFDLSRRAVSFMERQTKIGRPFFLQISHYADHLKFKANPQSRAKYERLTGGKKHNDPVFAGMNEDLDTGVGMILDALDKIGITDNTYVFYMADNGFDETCQPAPVKRQLKAWPLSYSKGYVWEGGIRVPFIVRGPGIPPGSVSRTPVIGFDLLPTFLAIINSDFALPKGIEGGNLLPLCTNDGVGEVKRSHDFLVFHYPMGAWPTQTAIIKDDYKLIKTWAFDRVELFNLKEDISEIEDLSEVLPDKTKELHLDMMNYLKRVTAIFPPEEELEIDRQGPLMKLFHKSTSRRPAVKRR